MSPYHHLLVRGHYPIKWIHFICVKYINLVPVTWTLTNYSMQINYHGRLWLSPGDWIHLCKWLLFTWCMSLRFCSTLGSEWGSDSTKALIHRNFLVVESLFLKSNFFVLLCCDMSIKRFVTRDRNFNTIDRNQTVSQVQITVIVCGHATYNACRSLRLSTVFDLQSVLDILKSGNSNWTYHVRLWPYHLFSKLLESLQIDLSILSWFSARFRLQELIIIHESNLSSKIINATNVCMQQTRKQMQSLTSPFVSISGYLWFGTWQQLLWVHYLRCFIPHRGDTVFVSI